MEALGPALEDGVDVATAVAPLAGVVKAGADLEFLDRIGIRKRRIRQLTKCVIGNRNSVNQVIIVVLTSAIDMDVHLASAQLRSVIQIRRSSR